jgi:AcrR family transcriptional regulator
MAQVPSEGLHDRLLDAAVELAAPGLDLAVPSLRAAARACGVSATAVYRYFASQSELNRAIAAHRRRFGDGTLRLAAGSVVVPLLTHASDGDDRRYPDPGVFAPERWLSPSAPHPEDASPFLPFGGGPRFCPGRNLALMEMTMVVAMVCHHFVLEADTSAGPVGERVTFAMMPTGLGIRLHPAPRPGRDRRPATTPA